MPSLDIIRAWKDPEYRDSLSADERAQLPAHPAGLIALTDSDLTYVAGGEVCTRSEPCTHHCAPPPPPPPTQSGNTCPISKCFPITI
jgi:mersacidin/lichenicidin family type 2 lantibiotic